MLTRLRARKQINRWIRQSLMPPPLPRVKIILRKPPFYGGIWSVFWHERWEIWLVRGDWTSKHSVHHERGHAFCRRHIKPHHQTAIMQILGKPWTPWFWGDCGYSPMENTGKPEAYEERFADAYARCSYTPSSKLSKKDKAFRKYVIQVAMEAAYAK